MRDEPAPCWMGYVLDIPEVYDWTQVTWAEVPQSAGVIHRATDWRTNQAVVSNLVENWAVMRQRGFRYRLMFQLVVSWIPILDQAEAMWRAIQAVGGLVQGEGVELDLESRNDSMVSASDAALWFDYMEARGVRCGTYANYSERFSGGELVRAHPAVTSRPFRLAYWNETTYPGDSGYWWARQYDCSQTAPGFSTICKNYITRYDVADRLTGYNVAQPPRPLDQDPPLNLARWYRQEHRAPWDGSWFGTMLHTTEGGSGSNAAENGAQYNHTRDTQVSCHVFADDNSTMQSVPDNYVSFSAGSPFNDMYRMIEMCAYAAWSRDDWFAHDGLLNEVAWNLARHIKQGVLAAPLVFCWAEDLCRNPRAKGIVTTHAEATRATNPRTPLGYVAGYPSPFTVNDHTDPGFGFYPPSSQRGDFDSYPIAEVFRRAESFVGLNPEEDDMTPEECHEIVDPQFAAIWEVLTGTGPDGLSMQWSVYDTNSYLKKWTPMMVAAAVVKALPPAAQAVLSDADKAAIASKVRDEFAARPLVTSGSAK